jgi:hypothetical protein
MIPAPKEVGAGTGRWPRGRAGEASGRLGLSTIWATSGTLNAAMRDRDIDAASLDGFGAFSLAAATRAVCAVHVSPCLAERSARTREGGLAVNSSISDFADILQNACVFDATCSLRSEKSDRRTEPNR